MSPTNSKSPRTTCSSWLRGTCRVPFVAFILFIGCTENLETLSADAGALDAARTPMDAGRADAGGVDAGGVDAGRRRIRDSGPLDAGACGELGNRCCITDEGAWTCVGGFTCLEGTCRDHDAGPCGGEGQPCCVGSAPCLPGLACSTGGPDAPMEMEDLYCLSPVEPPPCGYEGLDCCAAEVKCAPGLVCGDFEICDRCGEDGTACCTGTLACGPGLACVDALCTPPE